MLNGDSLVFDVSVHNDERVYITSHLIETAIAFGVVVGEGYLFRRASRRDEPIREVSAVTTNALTRTVLSAPRWVENNSRLVFQLLTSSTSDLLMLQSDEMFALI